MSSVWKHFSRARKYHTVLYETRDTIKNERKTIFHFKNTQTAGYQQNDRKLIHQISETEPEATRLLGCLVQYKLIYKGSTAKMNSQTETKYRSRQQKNITANFRQFGVWTLSWVKPEVEMPDKKPIERRRVCSKLVAFEDVV